MQTPKFTTHTPSFHAELKKRINDYFTEKGISPAGNYKLWTKGLILVVGFIALYVHVTFFTPASMWLAWGECIILGCLIAGIGFNIMHDGAHGSFSNSPVLNKAAAVTLGVLGGSHFMWNMKHNVIHHAYTNVDGVDDDIDAKPFLRMASTQKRYKMHKYQHLYFWFFYCWLHAFWIFFSDYKKYFTKKIGDIPLKKMSFKDHFYFWFHKVLSYCMFLVVPSITVGVVPAIVGFMTATLAGGFILSIVFQLAHTVEHTSFPMPDVVTGKLEDEWAVHQLKTTANFATKNKAISWYVGGLNFQVEHHLFPKISHIHYPAISKIIKKACEEYNVTYIEYKYMTTAVASHIAFLKEMGKA
ncbi:acyl-CoA desaturase [Danxiaibacter flavus]|uniref:Acyl-CoA desaturase n=1 Tax=Danxiaibacter flavus TaxID=3049108 RepID=A0ABV3ZDT0_9BACT|nr:acyl-CoA desaturase [Chitinophagaceae bacterium DXS]